MLVLGVGEIDNDAGAVLLNDTSVICGINEERLSRIKRYQGFPHRSVEWILKYAGITLKDVDYIAIAKADPTLNRELFYKVREYLANHDYFSEDDPSSLWVKTLNCAINRFRNSGRAIRLAKKMSNEIKDWIQRNDCGDKIVRVPHHYTHAACAYWASGYDRALAVTLDGQGEGITSTVYLVESGNFKLLKETRMPHSMGNFYSAVTKALGFTPAKHEGKITGLAAYATPDPKLLAEIRKIAFNKGEGTFFAPAVYGNYPRVLKFARQYGREQISAAFQIVLEEVVTRYITYYVKKYDIKNIVLGGGVFANVKLNQRIHEIEGLENIFIFPHMADGGQGYGAAQIVYRGKSKNRVPQPIKDVYWGPEFSDAEIKEALGKYDVNYRLSQDITRDIVDVLCQNKVVAHFNGRMEFGPRALGNRSILYPTTDPKVNDWLNKRLKRSEFMPFAPVTLAEKADECYYRMKGVEFTSQFMTVTLSCTPKMKQMSPAVVHVDDTARPQIVTEEINFRYYKILRQYFERTGIPSLVNTSFNMHEEPIVCTPDDAIRAYLDGHLDYLALGNYFVSRNGT